MRIIDSKLFPLLTALTIVAFVGCGSDSGPSLGGDVQADLAGEGFVQDVTESEMAVPDGMLCLPGSTKCMGSVFLVCKADGSDWISIACEAGTTCTTDGCINVGQDVSEQPDIIVKPPKDTVEPPEDIVQPPEDIVTPPQDTVVPPEDTVQPPDDVVEPPGCGGGPACGAGEECCVTAGVEVCLPEDECQTPPVGCEKDEDCPAGQKCCPGNWPGALAQCAEDCGGGPIDQMPTCDSTADCIGGQTCVDIMGWNALCLSECATNEDCEYGGSTCQEVGAFGYTLATVCDCATDKDCAPGLKCCDIPLINQTTCLTQCIGY
ncbi:MAG: hypothetical protein ISR64_07145 [Deltaproteobacteria bacterium]|nr:hypothetical protein [Deltaproteobacteria bacterium]